MVLGTTPWVDRHMRALLPALRNVVPDTWLPRTITELTEEYTVGFDATKHTKTTHFKNPVVEELGCGSYGCVMPTHEPALVFKLTTDISEAAFVARAMQLEPTAGIVEYKGLYATGLTHHGKPLFALWRTEAFSVGAWRYSDTHPDDSNVNYIRQVTNEADAQLRNFMKWATVARAYMQPHLDSITKEHAAAKYPPHSASGMAAYKHAHKADPAWPGAAREKLLAAAWRAYERAEPAQDLSAAQVQYLKGLPKVGVALRSCLYIAQEMSGNPSLYRVGEALAHYLENGILLADVHANNLGLDAEGEVLITDPGHAVVFHPRWTAAPDIPLLPYEVAPTSAMAGVYRDRLPGGHADAYRPRDFDAQQLEYGQRIEREHTRDLRLAREIAMDHLVEDPHYYEKLARMEAGTLGDIDLFPDAFDDSVPYAPSAEQLARDRCTQVLTALVVGQELVIGRQTWRVESKHGVTVYLTKGKGRKLYTLVVISFTPCTIEVREVWPGSGEIKIDVAPVATWGVA